MRQTYQRNLALYPAGYGNIFPAKSVLRARKADFTVDRIA